MTTFEKNQILSLFNTLVEIYLESSVYDKIFSEEEIMVTPKVLDPDTGEELFALDPIYFTPTEDEISDYQEDDEEHKYFQDSLIYYMDSIDTILDLLGYSLIREKVGNAVDIIETDVEMTEDKKQSILDYLNLKIIHMCCLRGDEHDRVYTSFLTICKVIEYLGCSIAFDKNGLAIEFVQKNKGENP